MNTNLVFKMSIQNYNSQRIKNYFCKPTFVTKMKYIKILLINILFLSSCTIWGQNPENTPPEKNNSSKNQGFQRKFSNSKNRQERAPKGSYKIINRERDTTFIDTSLSMKKAYKFNYLRKDDFKLLNFENIGGPYTLLSKTDSKQSITPEMGFETSHFNYTAKEKISYYNVATPFTELYFKTTRNQGQQLDAFFTVNTSENLNWSVAFNGVRSLGGYLNSLTSTKRFRSTLNYTSKNKKYKLLGHYTFQNLLHQVNGGLTTAARDAFLSGDTEFQDRSTLEVNFLNSDNTLHGKRYFIEQEYHLSKQLHTGVSLSHELTYESKKYYFSQDQTYEFFGIAQNQDGFTDKTIYKNFENRLALNFKTKKIGDFGVKANYHYINYGYDNILIGTNSDTLNSGILVGNRINDTYSSISGYYQNNYKNINTKIHFDKNIDGIWKDAYALKTTLNYKIDSDNTLDFNIELSNKPVALNKQLHQSNYLYYYWQNNFDHLKTIYTSIGYYGQKWGNLKANYQNIKNYTYFNRVVLQQETLTTNPIEVSTPVQYDGNIDVFKLEYFKDFKWNKFGLCSTLLLQEVIQNKPTNSDTQSIYNIPQIITRNSFYFRDKIFKDALLVQTGITTKWFSGFYVDGYDPVIAGNYVQNTTRIGGNRLPIPLTDLFMNLQVKQTRIFFSLENFQHVFNQNTLEVAPGYPTRDFIVRFGLVWNFFL